MDIIDCNYIRIIMDPPYALGITYTQYVDTGRIGYYYNYDLERSNLGETLVTLVALF
jgi:hypothetical protein